MYKPRTAKHSKCFSLFLKNAECCRTFVPTLGINGSNTHVESNIHKQKTLTFPTDCIRTRNMIDCACIRAGVRVTEGGGKCVNMDHRYLLRT